MRIEYEIRATPRGTIGERRVSYQETPPKVGDSITFGPGPSYLVLRVRVHPKSDRAVVMLRAPKHRGSL